MGRWLRRLAWALGLLVLVALSIPVVLIGPYLRDDLVLDRIVVAVALDWRDFGEAKALERLQWELDRRHIGMNVTDDSCGFRTQEDGRRDVECTWSVVVDVPQTDLQIPLHFVSRAQIGSDGRLQ